MKDERKTRQQLIFELEERTQELTRVKDALQTEIGGRKEVAEVLRFAKNHYKDLADLLPQTVFEADENGNLTFANRRAFHNFGYTQEDFDSGLNMIQMVAPDSRARALESFQRSFAGETYGSGVEITAQRKDGTTFPAIAFSSPIIEGGQRGGVRGLIIDISERKEKEEELRNSRELLRALAADQAGNLENERMRISREIRDGVGRVLSFLKMELSEISERVPETKKGDMASAIKLVEAAMRNVEKICGELSPPRFEDHGLLEAVKWEIQEFQKRAGIECTFRPAVRGLNLDRDYSLTVFRVMRDTMRNLALYSDARNIDVVLEKDGANLVLRMEGNSGGREMAHPNSVGFRGLRERVLLLGGQVNITVIPGRGTKITVRIPQRQSSL